MTTPPPAPTPGPAQNSFQLNRSTVISLLYLASFVTGITAIIGIVLAYMWQKEPHEAWEDSHYRWHIRTFWIGIVYSIICTILVFAVIGIVLFLALAIWFAVRTIKAMLAAQKGEPMSNVESWVI